MRESGEQTPGWKAGFAIWLASGNSSVAPEGAEFTEERHYGCNDRLSGRRGFFRHATTSGNG